MLIRQLSRSLRTRPLPTVFSVANVAVGVTVATVAVAITYATMLHPLPYREAGRIVQFVQPTKKLGTPWPFTYRFFYDIEDRLPGVDVIAALDPSDIVLQVGDQQAEIVSSVACSASLIDVLQKQPQLGRFLDPNLERLQSGISEAVISAELWKSRFHSNTLIVGRTIQLNGRPFRVIGVMPAGLRIPPLSEPPSIWIPLGADPMLAQMKKMFPDSWDRSAYLDVWARLRAKASMSSVQQQVEAVALPFAASDDATRPIDAGFDLVNLESKLRNEYRTENYVLIASALLILMMACSNASSLLLSRCLDGWQGLCIRHALGEQRSRIAYDILLESLVISVLAGAAGTLAATLLLKAINAEVLEQMLPLRGGSASSGILLEAGALSAGIAFVISLLPAAQVFRLRPSTVLRGMKEHATAGKANQTVRQAIVAIQLTSFATSLILFLYFQATYRSVTKIPLGFEPKGVVVGDLALTQRTDITGETWKRLASQLVIAVDRLPGLRSTIALSAPATRTLRTSFRVDPTPAGSHTTSVADFRPVGPTYFSVLGIVLLQGRTFSTSDSASASHVCIINRTFAKAYFRGNLPTAATITPTGGQPCRVVGVVGDVISSNIKGAAPPAIYVPFDQMPSSAIQGFMSVIIRMPTMSVRQADEQAAYESIHRVAHSLPLTMGLLESRVHLLTEPERFRALLMGLIALVAAALGVSGVYATTATYVVQRRREIAIRIALGARQPALIFQVTMRMLRLALIAVGFGLIASVLCIRLLGSFFFGVSSVKADILIGAAAMVCITVMVAAYVPSRRLLLVSPAEVLREL